MKKESLRDKDFDPFIDNSKKKTKELDVNDTKTKKSTKEKKVRKSKKVEEKENFFSKIDSFDFVLIIVFISMLVLTIFLGYKVHVAKENYKEYVKASIVVPVLGGDTNNQISVDISEMKKGDEKTYSFKVANNKDEDINPEEVVYGIQLTNTDSVTVEVYKNDGKENILPENNIILDNKLAAKEEQVDTYTLIIKAKKATSKEELMTIKIVS